MVANAWGWKRTTSKEPTNEGDVDEYKGHSLRAIAGIFNTQLVWECQACGLERTSTKYISETCPDA